MNAPHRYSGNVTPTPPWGVSRNSSSRLNHCSVIQVSSLLATQAWHLTYNKVFQRWNRPKTWLCEFLLLFFCVFTPPSPSSSSSSQPVCSLISACPEQIDEALVSPGMFIGERSLREEIGLELKKRNVWRRTVHLNKHLNVFSGPAWTTICRSGGSIAHTGPLLPNKVWSSALLAWFRWF